MFNKIPKKLWQGALLLVIAGAMFFAGYQFCIWNQRAITFNVASVNSPKKITTAITDRWELQITDRLTGKVRIYDQDILDAIFYQYQARRVYTQEGHTQ